MPVFLYVVESCWNGPLGLSLEPGIRSSQIRSRPEMQVIKQGVKLELRLPDGSKRQTVLVNYGISATKQPDGSLIREADPYLRFIIPGEIPTSEVPRGTELWWLDE